MGCLPHGGDWRPRRILLKRRLVTDRRMPYNRGAGEEKDPSAITGGINCQARDDSLTVQTTP
jgi:hypothetical protein